MRAARSAVPEGVDAASGVAPAVADAVPKRTRKWLRRLWSDIKTT